MGWEGDSQTVILCLRSCRFASASAAFFDMSCATEIQVRKMAAVNKTVSYAFFRGREAKKAKNPNLGL